MHTSQKDIEMILMRQLASCLSTPVFLVDPEGNLIFYNEPAEPILGLRFEDTGPMPASKLASIFHTIDENGKPMPAKSMPIVIALKEKRPCYRKFWILGLDGVKRELEVTAIPIIGQRKQLCGAYSIFQEVGK